MDEVVSEKEASSVEVRMEEKKDESSVEVKMEEKKEESSLEVRRKEKETSLEVKMDEKKEEPSLEVKKRRRSEDRARGESRNWRRRFNVSRLKSQLLLPLKLLRRRKILLHKKVPVSTKKSKRSRAVSIKFGTNVLDVRSYPSSL